MAKLDSEVSVERWQNKIRSINEGIAHIYKTKEFFDIEFEVENRIFQAHKMVVSARSPRFEEILLNSKEQKIKIDNVSEDGFENLLKFIYLEELDDLEYNVLLQTYRAAFAYQQKSLLEKCKAMILKYEVNVNNVCSYLNEASDIPVIKENCLQFLHNNTATILSSDHFKDATIDTVLIMFQSGYFKPVPPMLLISNVLRWAENQYPVEKRNLVRKLLLETKIMGKLGFEKLTWEDLDQVNDAYEDLLTDKEIRQLFSHAKRPQAGKPLPSWCETEPVISDSITLASVDL